MVTRAILFIALFLQELVGNASCLAAVSPSESRRIAYVISTNKNGGQSQAYTFPSETANVTVSRIKPSQNVFKRVETGLRSTFLPSGYPTRTPVGYLQFSVWSWIQDLSTQLRGVLATQRILEGVGVGRPGATALSALMNFLLRDGCGMFATLLFTATAASKFRSDVKRWRIFADIMVDIGMTLEVAAVHVPQHLFLPMICVGNMCKAICGVAAGACGGAINLHWAQGSDISDIQAKFGAQHTVTASLGLIFAALFAKTVAQVAASTLWALYAVLTILHIFANRQCMRLMALDSFNTGRMRLVAADFLTHWSRQDPALVAVPSPKDITKREPLLFLPSAGKIPIQLGVSFDEFLQKTAWSESDVQWALQKDSSYLLAIGRTSRGRLCIPIALVQNASSLQQTKAYFHALLLKRRAGEGVIKSIEDQRALDRLVADEVTTAWPAFVRDVLRAGWDLKKSELQSGGYEIAIQFRKQVAIQD